MIKTSRDQVYDIEYRAEDGLRVQNVGAFSRSNARDKAIMEMGISPKSIVAIGLAK